MQGSMSLRYEPASEPLHIVCTQLHYWRMQADIEIEKGREREIGEGEGGERQKNKPSDHQYVPRACFRAPECTLEKHTGDGYPDREP